MTQQNYSEIESGYSKLTDEMLLKILNALEIQVVAFMEFDPDLVFQNSQQQGGQYNAAQTDHQQ